MMQAKKHYISASKAFLGPPLFPIPALYFTMPRGKWENSSTCHDLRREPVKTVAISSSPWWSTSLSRAAIVPRQCGTAAPCLYSCKNSGSSVGKAAAEIYLQPTEPAVILGIGNKNLNLFCLEAMTQSVRFLRIGRCRALVPGCPKQTQTHAKSHCGTLHV